MGSNEDASPCTSVWGKPLCHFRRWIPHEKLQFCKLGHLHYITPQFAFQCAIRLTQDISTSDLQPLLIFRLSFLTQRETFAFEYIQSVFWLNNMQINPAVQYILKYYVICIRFFRPGLVCQKMCYEGLKVCSLFLQIQQYLIISETNSSSQALKLNLCLSKHLKLYLKSFLELETSQNKCSVYICN